jgi:hypothetical protein
MGSRKSGPQWLIALFVLVFGFGLVSVATLAWLGKGRSRSGVSNLRDASSRHQDQRNPDELQEFRGPPFGLDDPRLESLRQAAHFWRRSAGPRRLVIDQVCLVPDVRAFLEAIAMWDERHFFPILIDEPAWTLPFLRAFRPARVVRYAGLGGLPTDPAEPSGRRLRAHDAAPWHEAILAVARAWSGPAQSDANLPRGGGPPRWLGPTPPGAVLASPDGRMLAGAVALAAGRFQPLVRLEPDSWPLNDQGAPGRRWHFGDVLTLTEAWYFARQVQARVAPLFAHYDRLGDECDFLTLAGDWPYRFNNNSGPNLARGDCALDDLIGRTLPRGPTGQWLLQSRQRWAYTGRLLGDPAASVARAMGALFLQPSSALLWNTYGGGNPWSNYTMGPAVDRLRQIFPGSGSIVHRAGKQADLMSWHRAIDPLNHFELILMNSTGGPGHFTITGGPGRASDLPSGIPVAVSTIHSFSAADPTDPQTIAGRWLDQGAFVYYGSMNEPYVDAFRCPGLIAELITAEVPLAAALRQGEFEAFGHPWRLVYLGDPLYHIEAAQSKEGGIRRPDCARLTTSDWRQVAPAYAAWQVVEITATPAAKLRLPESHSEDSENARLGWCLDAAIEQLTAKPLNDNTLPGDRAPDAGEPVDWRSFLRQVRRDRLDPKLRPVFDDLLIDTLRATGEPLELTARLGRIPTAERGSRVWQALESCATDRLWRLVQDQEPARIFGWVLGLWDEVMRQPWPEDSAFPEQFTERVATLAGADAPRRLRPWHDRLRQTGDALATQPSRYPHAKVITAERARVEAKLGGRG